MKQVALSKELKSAHDHDENGNPMFCSWKYGEWLKSLGCHFWVPRFDSINWVRIQWSLGGFPFLLKESTSFSWSNMSLPMSLTWTHYDPILRWEFSQQYIYISYTYIVTWCHIAKPSPANNKLLRNGSYGSYKILRNDPSEVLAGPEELQMRPARSWRISFRRNRRKWCFHSLRCHRDAKRCTATRLDTLLM
jgi:hypothetical protein